MSTVSLKWLGAAAGVVSAVALARWCRSIGVPAALVAAGAIAVMPNAVIAGATVRDYACGLAATIGKLLA